MRSPRIPPALRCFYGAEIRKGREVPKWRLIPSSPFLRMRRAGPGRTGIPRICVDRRNVPLTDRDIFRIVDRKRTMEGPGRIDTEDPLGLPYTTKEGFYGKAE